MFITKVLLYFHRYVSLWCVLMGYFILIGLLCFTSLLTRELIVNMGIILLFVVFMISLLGYDFAKGIYKMFGVWW